MEGRSSFVRGFTIPIVVFFLPLALQSQNAAKVIAAKALTAEAVQCDSDASNVSGCHANYPSGCGRKRDKDKKFIMGFVPGFKPEYDPYLGYFKNQIPKVLPKSQGLLGKNEFAEKTKQVFPKQKPLLGRNDHAAHSQDLLNLGEGQYFTVIGYLYYSQISEGGESSNCDLPKDEPAEDYHIGIGFDAPTARQIRTGKLQPKTGMEEDPLKQQSIVVEMTPHYRAKYHKGKWTHNLLGSIQGRQVKIVGQLLLDNDHMEGNAVCGNGAPSPKPNDKPCWRLSPWELHPVTEFYVCKSDSCAENSSDWVPLDDAPAQGIGKQ